MAPSFQRKLESSCRSGFRLSPERCANYLKPVLSMQIRDVARKDDSHC